jgi:prolyl oligopeptidase
LRLLLPALSLLLLAAAAPASDDPYLWLEDVDGARALAQVKEWNKATEDLLTRDPQYESYRARARAILDDERQIAAPERVMGDEVANLWRDAKNPRGLWRISPTIAPATRAGAF